MDALVDQRAAALRGPTALDRPAVIRRRTVPLDVGIGLQDPAEALLLERAFQVTVSRRRSAAG